MQIERHISRVLRESITLVILIFCLILPLSAQQETISVKQTDQGWKMLVDGQPHFVKGINWGYKPIGTNYTYSLWNQSPEYIKKALDYDMSRLQKIGVNAIRVYSGMQPEWITYIYETYGIHTMINHTFGRYGLMLDGQWVATTDYSDPRVEELLLREITEFTETYKNTPGVLLYLIGNENNYGLFWKGAETKDIPQEEQDRAYDDRARHMYSLMNTAAEIIKSIDDSKPVALCNGDNRFLEIIAEETPEIDIFGINVYRGEKFGDLYDEVKEIYGKPVLLTEFGADAFNAKTEQEDQRCQARYVKSNWEDMYENVAGFGRAENAIGGFTFQHADGWWKYLQEENLSIHDTNASWSNGGYECDHVSGENNMNEEWFGVMARGEKNEEGITKLYPRAAYYVLQSAHQFDPYQQEEAGLSAIQKHFSAISIDEMMKKAQENTPKSEK
jgi:beta-galactosidase/beta-glucuronidase